MAAKEMKDIKFIQTLKDFNKPYFTLFDLEKILNVKKDSLYVTLSRLVKSGVLIRLKRGIYQPEFKEPELEKTANELYYPSYLSFETGLSRYGILSQIPYALTFATTKKSKKFLLLDREIEYRQLKKDYFFGFTLNNGIYIAEPEKALLDQLYMISRGKALKDMSEWSLVNLKKNKFIQYSKKFPKSVQKKAKELTLKFGNYVATSDEREFF
jgi:predicted transcriptional regulator of viral defense system